MRAGALMEAGWSGRGSIRSAPLRAWLGAAMRRFGAPALALAPRGAILSMTLADPAALPAAFARPGAGLEAASPTGSAGFHEIVLPHLDAAYNLARFLTRDADAADDIVQEAFLRAVRAFSGFRGGDARAWLLAIVRNCVRDWAAERNRARALSEPLSAAARPGDEADAGELDRFDPDQDTPETALLRDSEASLLRRLIEALPDAFREVLVLREFDDLSYKQIADITATPIGTVMSRLARARQMLAQAWRGRGGDDRP